MMRLFSLIGILSVFVGMAPADALSEIVVHDMVAVVGREVMLAVETKEGLFSKGGDMVEFFIDGRSIGKNLSGGDGIALKRFVPAREGQYKLRITSGSEKDEGILLAVRRSAQVVLVDVEGSLVENYVVFKARSGSIAAVKNIRKKYPAFFSRQVSLASRR